MMKMTIDDLKRALVEVRDYCRHRGETVEYQCSDCPFNGDWCRINDTPEFWAVDAWKEDTHETDC